MNCTEKICPFTSGGSRIFKRGEGQISELVLINVIEASIN